MSRINRPRIDAGDTIDATDLNNRFDDYSQAGALDVANHGIGSVDLPQIQSNGVITLNSDSEAIGTGSWTHSTPQNIACMAASPPTLTEVGGAGNGRLSLSGLAGWTVAAGEVLRVYWNFGAEPNVTGRPYAAPSYGTIPIDDGGGGSTDLNDCLACWVAHLQWNISDPTLATGWVAVPGQNDFQSSPTSVTALAASSVIPAYLEYSPEGHANNGQMSSAPTQKALRWMGVTGHYFWAPSSGSITVYGLRVVVSGIYHAGFSASLNQLLDFTGLGGACSLDVSQGRLSALHQRIG